MKFARAATGRPRFVSCDSSFHGVTLGPLSIVGDEFFKEGFGPLLPGCARVPFGDLARLEAELRSKDVAAFIVEPIQGRLVTLPPAGYLEAAQELCRRYGTLFVVDEIQTGLGPHRQVVRARALAARSRTSCSVGKALSGGYMPVAAMVTRREIFQRAVGTLERSYVHQSTYGRNRLSMAAGLAALRVIERDRLVERSAQMGDAAGRWAARAAAAARADQGGPRRRADDRHRAAGAALAQGPARRAPDADGERGPVPAAGRDPAAPRPRRDHDGRRQERRDQAAAAADAVRAEAQQFLGALDAVLTDCEGDTGKNWSVVRDIAISTLRRREQETDSRASGNAVQRSACRPLAGQRLPGHRRHRLHRRPPGRAAGARRLPGALPGAPDQRHLAAGGARRRAGRRRSHRRADSLARAAEGCRYVFHCGAMVSDWATAQGGVARQRRRAPATC